MKVKIITTIGPSSNNPEILRKLKDRGTNYFRINLSHTDEEEIEQKIKDIKDFGVPVILDTEGSQIRSGNRDEIFLEEGSDLRIYKKDIKCTPSQICLNPLDSIDNLSNGDLIFIDFNSVLLKVYDTSKINKGYILCKVMIGGLMGGRKAVFVDSPTFKMPPFSKKDRRAVELAKKYGITNFTLSFMEQASDVRIFKEMYPETKVYSKIESKKGLQNFMEIAKESDGVLIDRGDLSHQVPLERIPLIQKFIIKKLREMKKEVFIATNTLEQMSSALKPNKAEVNDIINTILDGATGIALTRETAVGKYPVETVNMLVTLMKQIEFLKADKNNVLDKIEESNYLYSPYVPRLLTAPHGGILVNRMLNGKYIQIPKRKIDIDEETLMDVEQIAIGAYSPLEGFMNKEDFYSVVEKMRLFNGIIWPVPIILQVDEKTFENIKIGENISLCYGKDKEVYAVLNVEEIFKINKEEAARKIYGTNDLNHPGVKRFVEKGEFVVGGKITLIKRRDSPYKKYELTPSQTRRIFVERGWSKVIGFHTRNVIHKSHEFIQLEGLKSSLADGLFVHPVIGKKKKGDFEADVIINSYEKMIDRFYPKNKVILCSWASYSRYAGPREALFTALVRKNFGCSHFIVGRDHTGVGNYYSPTASHEIFDRFTDEDLGIIPIKFDKVFYSAKKKEHIHEKDNQNHPEKDKLHISGTKAREMLMKGKTPPEWFMRPEISKIIIGKIKKGEKVFVE